MELSIRLSAIANLVPKGSTVIDVGTDHAYIPIYLVKEQIATSCLATDINKGPLEKAAKNLKAYGITNVALKQTNGLVGIESGQGEVVMISGMGGFLIKEILEKSLPLVQSTKKLILQPQQDVEVVRIYLHEIGFKIEEENFVEDDEKYYTIIAAVPGEDRPYTALEYLYGKELIEKQSPILRKCLSDKLAKQEGIYTSLKEASSESIIRRKTELEAEIQGLREVLECLN